MSWRKSSMALFVDDDGTEAIRVDGWHERERPVRWGSVSKVLTAGLARIAVEEGRLSFDTAAADVLGSEIPPGITVESLIKHQSGLGRMHSLQTKQLIDPYKHWTTEHFDRQIVPTLAAEVSDESAGETVYSNLGYAVLTRVLELTNGGTWLELVIEQLVEAAGVNPERFAAALATGDGAVDALSIFGNRLADWDVGVGPFVGAGGLVAPMPELAEVVVVHSSGGALDPRLQPHAWSVDGQTATHQGALMRSGAVLVLRPSDSGRGPVGVGHAVGGMPGMTDTRARLALEELINDQASQRSTR